MSFRSMDLMVDVTLFAAEPGCPNSGGPGGREDYGCPNSGQTAGCPTGEEDKGCPNSGPGTHHDRGCPNSGTKQDEKSPRRHAHAWSAAGLPDLLRQLRATLDAHA
jgi:hypothetical protein